MGYAAGFYITVAIAVLAFAIISVLLYRPPRTHEAPPQLGGMADGFIPKAEYDSLLNRVEATKEELGQLSARHADQLAALRQEQFTEMREYRSELELEFEKKKQADRRDSNARSRTALVAKIAEHLAPLLKGFPYNFKEVRHLGELVDFIVYEGLEDGRIDNVIFLEVTTKASGRKSNPNERMLKDAIDNGRVKYEVFVPDTGRLSNDDNEGTAEEPRGADRPVDDDKPRRAPRVRRTTARPAVGEQ